MDLATIGSHVSAPSSSPTVAVNGDVVVAAPIHLVVHIDIQPDHRPDGEALLVELVERSRSDRDIGSVVLLREHVLDNHFMLICRFPDRECYSRFVAAEYVRAVRAALHPWLGSPWDERPASRVVTP